MHYDSKYINFIRNELKKINTLKGLSYKDIDSYGDKLGLLLVNADVSSTQLRKIHSIIKGVAVDIRLDDKIIDKVYMIPSRLAYIAGRQKKARDICDLLSHIIKDKVKDKDDVLKLNELIDSILAYFVYYENKR